MFGAEGKNPFAPVFILDSFVYRSFFPKNQSGAGARNGDFRRICILVVAKVSKLCYIINKDKLRG